MADRPIPIISFVARQARPERVDWGCRTRSRKKTITSAMPSKHWEGRFHRITLEDRNLPRYCRKAGTQV